MLIKEVIESMSLDRTEWQKIILLTDADQHVEDKTFGLRLGCCSIVYLIYLVMKLKKKNLGQEKLWCFCIDYLWNLCLGLTQVYVLSFMFLMRCSLQSFFPAMTKIVGTLGPKSRSVEIISGCLQAGMSGISGPVAFIIPYLF